MKKAFIKNLPYLCLTLLLGTGGAIVGAVMNLKMMDIADMAIAGDRDLVFETGISIIKWALLLLILSSLEVVARSFYRRKANFSLRKYFMVSVFNKNINEFARDRTGEYLSGITNDLSTIDNDYIEGLLEFILAIILFFVTLFVLAIVNYIILILIIALGIIVSIVSMLSSKPLKRMTVERTELYSEYTSYLNEVLGAFRIIKSNNLLTRIKESFRNKGEKLQNKTYEIDKFSTFLFVINNMSGYFVILVVLGVSVYFVIQGRLTFGGIVLIVTNMSMLFNPFQKASELLPKILASSAIFKNLDKLLSNRDEYVETKEFHGFKKEISIENISFSYEEDKEILKDFSLKIEKGKKYLITGPSGRGKSTLMKILRKYHYPQSGSIYVDGIPLRDIKKESYFTHIANVDQNIFIFDDTLYNNLTLYRDCTREKVMDAVEASGLSKFVSGLEDGLDTVMKDNGRNISGGEKSRIAIARAFIDDVEIMFLDEPFANLDYKTAEQIEKTILSRDGLTVINVSHLMIDENKKGYDKVINMGSL